jgi:hypothetical protein
MSYAPLLLRLVLPLGTPTSGSNEPWEGKSPGSALVFHATDQRPGGIRVPRPAGGTP